MNEKNTISREETVAEAKHILQQAIAWIDGDAEAPQTNNMDAIALVSRSLSWCGIK